VAPEPVALPPAAPLGVLVDNGPRNVAKVAITLNAAYAPESSWAVQTGALPPQFNPAVLDALTLMQVPATVFVTGVWAADHPDAIARMAADDGVELANLTQSHRGWTSDCYGLPFVGDAEAQRFEITATADQIEAMSGVRPNLLRFPGLCSTPDAVALATSMGDVVVGSDVTFYDSFLTDPVAGAQAIIDQVQAGSIIVMHITGPPNAPVTVEMLNILVPQLRERGLQLVTVGELLGTSG